MSSTIPQSGFCPDKKCHTITISTSRSFTYEPHLSCFKCNLPLNQIYHKDVVLYPHYYQCKECSMKLCFNCASKGNPQWDYQYPSSPPKDTLTRAPTLKITRLKSNNLIQNITESMQNKLLKKIIHKVFNGAKSMIHFITKNATTEELDEIYDLILNEKAKHHNCEKKSII